MKAANLVSVRIKKVAQVNIAHITFTGTGRLFYAGTTIRNCDVVKLLNLLWRVASESNRGTIGDCRRSTVDGLRETECRAVMHEKKTCLPGRVDMIKRCTRTEYTQHSRVESSGFLNIARTYHYVIYHGLVSVSLVCGVI